MGKSAVRHVFVVAFEGTESIVFLGCLLPFPYLFSLLWVEVTVWLRGVGATPFATLSLQLGEMCAGVLPSHIRALGILQALAK